LSPYTNEDKSINSEEFPATINKHLSQVIETNKRLNRPQKNNFQTVVWKIFESTIQQKKTIQHIKGIALSDQLHHFFWNSRWTSFLNKIASFFLEFQN